MKYLLDTDICIYLIKKKPSSVIQRLRKIPNSDVCLSTISVFELQFGVENSQSAEKTQRTLNQFLAPIHTILPVDEAAAGAAARIRASLKSRGVPIGPYDLLIAAVALSQGLILVTNNIREFQRVDGLKYESWV